MYYCQLDQLSLCVIVTGCSKEDTSHSETKCCPSHVVSWGIRFSKKKKLMEEKQNKRLEGATQSRSTNSHWYFISHQMTREVEDDPHKENWSNDVWGCIEIADRIISHFHLSVVIFYNNYWMSKSILFCLLTTGFLGGASLIRKLCRPRTLGYIDCCHWVTRAPWSCSWC